MDRRRFLQYTVPLGLGLASLPGFRGWAATDPAQKTKLPPNPPYLKAGDRIGITCPAGPVEEKQVRGAVTMLQRWGFDVRLGKTIGRTWQRFGGTDNERAADMQQLLDDPEIHAILFGKGGYGVMRMMDRLNWDRFADNPKWLIGYSDITAIHCHVHSRFGIPTMHADMAMGFNGTEDEAAQTLRDALTGKRIDYSFGGHPLNRPGQMAGALVGGNLSLIYAMQGSPSELKTDGKLLFIEDVSEFKYTVDRMLMNLKRSGKFDKLAGLIVGGFTATREDNDYAFRMSMEEIIFEKVAEYGYPVCFGFPAGHIRRNLALKLGMHYNLYVTKFSGNLSEISDPHPPLPPPPEPPKADSIRNGK